MTDLLSPSRRIRATSDDAAARRPLSVTAVVAGLVASGSVLVTCMAVGIAGWFAADAGRYGDTPDAIRVGADAWLMAHGSGLRFDGTTVGAVPLALTLLCGYVVFRLGCWAGATSAVDDLRAVATGTTVLAGVYAVVVLLTAVLFTTPSAEVGLGRAFLGAALLAGGFGAAGVLAGAGRSDRVGGSVPQRLRVVASTAAAVTCGVFAAGALLLLTALLLDFGTAATVLSRLHADGPGGLMYTVVVAAFVPNAALLASSYLLGPGFAVGTGTLVSPTAVMLGPVPAFPLLAALPDDGPTPAWTTWLLGVPVAVAAAVTCLAGRRFPAGRYEAGGGYGLLGGLVAGLAVTLLTALAGGPVGPGRMAEVGVVPREVLLAACVALGGGGLLGGLAATWRGRRARADQGESTSEAPAGGARRGR